MKRATREFIYHSALLILFCFGIDTNLNSLKHGENQTLSIVLIILQFVLAYRSVSKLEKNVTRRL